MEIEFNIKIEKYFNDENKIIRKIGIEIYRLLLKRFKQIEASNNFDEYLSNGIGKPHKLKGNFENTYAVHLDSNYRILININVKEHIASELKRCKKVIIIGVVDYHGNKESWLIP